MIRVLSATDELSLLTSDEVRHAVGAPAENSKELLQLGLRASAMITAACGVISDGVNPPTLKLESVAETIRLGQSTVVITLARRPVVSIASLTEAGSLLTRDVDFEVDARQAG